MKSGAVNVSLVTSNALDGWANTDTLSSIEDLRGSQFSDTLAGDGVANRLDGGRNTFATNPLAVGNDTLTGNGGADTFVFNTTLDALNNTDTITDFVSGTDKLELEDSIFIGLIGTVGVGNLVQGAGAVALDADDFLVYNTLTGFLYYDAGGNIGAAAVQFATLSSLPILAVADFIIA